MEENLNLVEEDEGILMMKPSLWKMTWWYPDIGASNHMCGHKHLVVIQEIEDEHVSFEDSMKVPIKGKGKICFSQMEK